MSREAQKELARERYQSQNGLTDGEADALWPSLPARVAVEESVEPGEESDADEEAPAEPVRNRRSRSTSTR